MRTPLRRYYHGRNLVAMRDVQAGTTRYYHFNHQGTVQCLTNEQGQVTDRFAADAWGRQVKRTGTSINRQWYVGNLGYYRELDRALDYVRARYLRPVLGRFLAPDPVTSDRAWCPYSYADNMPSRRVDPSGLITVVPVLPIIWLLPDEEGPATNCCGKRCAYWSFVLSKPARFSGWLVQRVTRSGSARRCQETMVYDLGDPRIFPPFWEAWKVPKGKTESEDTTKDGYTDVSRWNAYPGFLGGQMAEGEIRFFCSDVIKDEPAGWQARSSDSGTRPSTRTPPAWWTRNLDEKDEAVATRWAASAWNCCAPRCGEPDPRHSKSWAEPAHWGIQVADACSRGTPIRCEDG